MLKPLTLALAIAFTATAQADTGCNVKLREGNLQRLEMPGEVERQILKPDLTDETGKKPPKSGHDYAVLTIKLAAGKSIGLYDYALKEENGTESFNAVGMSVDGGPFKVKVWEVRAGGDTKVSWVGIHQEDDSKEFRKGSESVDADSVVKLLFEVPAGSKRFSLVSRLLEKSLKKEYGVSQVLDFDSMEAAAEPPKKEEPPAEEKEEKPEN